jgi:putative transposase
MELGKNCIMKSEVWLVKKRKHEQPSVAIIDSQSVKLSNKVANRGYDGNKKIKGRKRHILVDTLGFIHSIAIHEANIHDSVGAKLVLWKVKDKMPNLQMIWADLGYAGKLIEYIFNFFGWKLWVVGRSNKEIQPLPFRWIVERTFSWLNNYRGLVKDYEYSTKSSENLVYIAMLHLMIRRLA